MEDVHQADILFIRNTPTSRGRMADFYSLIYELNSRLKL